MSDGLDLALIRHGRTQWNEERRIQGHSDIPLSERGAQEIASVRLPDDLYAARWVTSPLLRTRETARLLGVTATPVDALIEMDWGDWSGLRLEDLRSVDPEGMAANENKGLTFRPAGGETPAEVQERVLAWLADQPPGPLGVVTHKGVILALMAKALAWDMLGKPPVKMDWTALHRFRLAGGRLNVVDLNIPLTPRSSV